MIFYRDMRVVSFFSTMLFYYVTFANATVKDKCPNFHSISFNELGFMMMNQCLYGWSYRMRDPVDYPGSALSFYLNVFYSSVSYAAIAALDQQYNGKSDFYTTEHIARPMQISLLASVGILGIPFINHLEISLLSRNSPVVPKNSADDKTAELHAYYLRNSSSSFPYKLFAESGSFKNVVVDGVEEEALFINGARCDYRISGFVKSLLKEAHNKRDGNAISSRSFCIEE